MEKWICIRYDYVPEYYKMCMIQGHDEDQFYVKHLELYKDKKKKEANNTKEENKVENKDKGQTEEVNSGDEGFIGPRRKNGGRKPQQGWRNQPQYQWNVSTKNKFGTLVKEGDNGQQGKEKAPEKEPIPTKEWVEGTFKKKERGKDVLNKDQASTTKEPDPTDKESPQGARSGNLKEKQQSLSVSTKGDSQIAELNVNDGMEDPQLADSVSNTTKEIGGQNQAQLPQEKNPTEDSVEGTDKRDDDEDLIEAIDLEKGDELEHNIQHISNARDLSPRHSNSLKTKKGRSKMPL